jgi:hypothetical protein
MPIDIKANLTFALCPPGHGCKSPIQFEGLISLPEGGATSTEPQMDLSVRSTPILPAR